MMPVIQRAEVEIGGKPLSFEVGRVALLANCSVLVRYGDTECLVSSVMAEEEKKDITFLPLTVNFEERMYAAGKIPGGFIKREGRPSEPSILAGRVIDRPIRPLFPPNLRNEVNVTIMVLSIDGANIPDMIGLNGAACSLFLSDIPFFTPIAGVRISLLNGEYTVNPSYEQKDASELDLIVVGTKEKIVMIEAGAHEVSEDEITEAVKIGHREIIKICNCIEKFRTQVGLPKKEPVPVFEIPSDVKGRIENLVDERIEDIYKAPAKKERERAFRDIYLAVDAIVAEKCGSSEEEIEATALLAWSHDYEFNLLKKKIRARILEKEQRPDGRGLREIRKISCEVGITPRAHGTGLFTRGETQVLSTVTLGAPGDLQVIDDIHPYIEKRYLHHYQALPFSYGETGPLRGPGRREIGHGALAERAIKSMIPDQEKFPYVIRVSSDVMMSNGSTSMGATCSSTLALMDAGIPIRNPVSGIAMGLVIGDDGKYKILSDIIGTEDFMGDMDFKVAGTHDGITAIQMDLKIGGITIDMIKATLEQAKEGRAFILEKMLETIPAPRPDLSPYAPRITIIHVKPEKIGEIIGPGGKTIRKIIEETGVDIDIEDDGRVYITSTNAEMAREAIHRIEELVAEVEVGKIYLGKITRIENYGAFVQVLPGKDGLLHVSQISRERVSRVNDVLKIGQDIFVKVIGIDEMGRIDLTAIGVEGNKEIDAIGHGSGQEQRGESRGGGHRPGERRDSGYSDRDKRQGRGYSNRD
jgi:polyribonucleotide nucleotidyltransferase